MKWRLAGLVAGMIAVAGQALADPECRSIVPPQDQPYPGTLRLHVDAADINRRVFHIHETLPLVDREELALLYPEWLPGALADRSQPHQQACRAHRQRGQHPAWLAPRPL